MPIMQSCKINMNEEPLFARNSESQMLKEIEDSL